MKNIKTFSLITLLALVFLAVPAGSALAAKETMDDVETALNSAKTDLDKAEQNYNEKKAALDKVEKAIDEQVEKFKQEGMAKANQKYDQDIANAQKEVDNCKESCAEKHAKLAKLQGEKQAMIDAVNKAAETGRKNLETANKTDELKQALKEAESTKNKAQKAYNKAADNVKDFKADAEKDLKNAQEDLEKAKENIAKKCSGSGYDKQKCENAKEKMTKAENDIKEAQNRLNDYYSKYPDEKPKDTTSGSTDSDTTSEDETSDKPKKSAEEIAKEYAEKQSAADKANNDYNKAVQDYQKAEKEYYDAAFLCAHGQKEACAAMEESKEKLAELKAKADEAYAKKLKADEELNAFLLENPTADMKGKKSNYESLTSQVNNLQNQYDQAVANCKAAADKSKYYRTPDGTMMTGEEFCALADTLKDRLDQANKDLEAAKEAYDAEFAKLSDEEKGYYFMASEGELDETVYAENNDVFTSVTRRAARILAGLRPVAYLLAAFGLVGFAYAAVFNKISWKWFANISIGLFLVANMGRLIEYMVYPNAEDKQEIIAKPLDSFGDKTEKHSIKKVLSDADYEYVEPVAIYEPTPPKAEVLPNIEEVPEEEVPVDEKSGFCKSGKIMDCVNDIMNVIKNATDTINTVKQTAVGIGAAGEGIVTNVNNIMSLIKNLNPLKPKAMMTSLGQISSNIDQAMRSLKGIADRTASADQQIADTWGIEGEYGEETTKTKAGIEKAINSMGNIKNGIDNALNTLGGLVNVLF